MTSRLRNLMASRDEIHLASLSLTNPRRLVRPFGHRARAHSTLQIWQPHPRAAESGSRNNV